MRVSRTARTALPLLLLVFSAAAADGEAALRRENDALKQRNAELAAELESVRARLAESEARRRNGQLWLGEILDGNAPADAPHREEALLISLDETVRRGTALALTAAVLCDDIEELLRELPLADSRRVRMMLRVDRTRRDIREFAALTSPAAGDDPLRNCRVLAVNPGLKIAVLSVGATNGAFAGLIYNAGAVKLRLTSVRPYVSAAVVVEGSFDAITPGMTATSVSTGNNVSSPFLLRQNGRLE